MRFKRDRRDSDADGKFHLEVALRAMPNGVSECVIHLMRGERERDTPELLMLTHGAALIGASKEPIADAVSGLMHAPHSIRLTIQLTIDQHYRKFASA